MGNFLDAWAEREQRRIERRQAQPPKPVPFPRFFEALGWFFGAFAMMTRFIIIPAFLIGIVGLLIQHTVQSIALAFGLAALLSLSVFHMVTTLQLRRENHQGWFTGRTLKSN